jgi:hypothetical protein
MDARKLLNNNKQLRVPIQALGYIRGEGEVGEAVGVGGTYLPTYPYPPPPPCCLTPTSHRRDCVSQRPRGKPLRHNRDRGVQGPRSAHGSGHSRYNGSLQAMVLSDKGGHRKKTNKGGVTGVAATATAPQPDKHGAPSRFDSVANTHRELPCSSAASDGHWLLLMRTGGLAGFAVQVGRRKPTGLTSALGAPGAARGAA